MKIFKKIFFAVINIIILIISFFIPKTDKIFIVGGWFGKRFADNSKYFYLYADRNKDELKIKKVVWITRSNEVLKELKAQGYSVYKPWSLYSIWYHLRAKVHLIDQSVFDINPFLSVRSIRVNLWHGFPLKKIGTYSKNRGNVKLFTNSKLIKKIIHYSTPGLWGKHYLLATSKFSAEILGKAFGVPNDRVIISGYPRNYEPIVDKPIKYISQNERECFIKIKDAKKQGCYIIGYFPTFRDRNKTLVFGTQKYDELQELFECFSKMNIKIVGKFHFADKNNDFADIHNQESFVSLPSDADVYTFLSEIDILITDYSSICFDYLLWGKPIIFFPYDLEYYRDDDRGLIFDYEEFTPGPKVYNVKELIELLSNGIDRFKSLYINTYSPKAFALKEKIFENPEDMKINHLIEQIGRVSLRERLIWGKEREEVNSI